MASCIFLLMHVDEEEAMETNGCFTGRQTAQADCADAACAFPLGHASHCEDPTLEATKPDAHGWQPCEKEKENIVIEPR
jgi:hypothetical protein